MGGRGVVVVRHDRAAIGVAVSKGGNRDVGCAGDCKGWLRPSAAASYDAHVSAQHESQATLYIPALDVRVRVPLTVRAPGEAPDWSCRRPGLCSNLSNTEMERVAPLCRCAACPACLPYHRLSMQADVNVLDARARGKLGAVFLLIHGGSAKQSSGHWLPFLTNADHGTGARPNSRCHPRPCTGTHLVIIVLLLPCCSAAVHAE